MQLIDQLKPMLDSEHIRESIKSLPTIADVQVKQATVSEQIDAHAAQVSELIRAHCEFVAMVNRQLAYWDGALTVRQKQMK